MRPPRPPSTVPAPVAARVESTASECAGRLFVAHSGTVLAVCRALLRDGYEAEDAAQQAFLSAWRALCSGVRPHNGAAWITSIARNECRTRIRRRMAQPIWAPLEAAMGAPAAAQPDVDELGASIEELRAALHGLPAREREALALRELRGLRYDEVAAAMGIRVASVEPLLWRARRRIRETRCDRDPASARGARV